MNPRAASLLLAACLAASPALAQDPLPRTRPESVGLSSDRLGRITHALRVEVNEGRIPGAVIAIARKGKLVYYEAFGFLDKAAGTPMPKDAIFSIASMTQPMVAVGALMLVEENQMRVNEPVGRYLPQLDKMAVAVARTDASGKTAMQTEPAKRKPTIQDLMRHTAGLTYGNRGDTELHKMYPTGSTWAAENLTGPAFLEMLGNLPLHYQPGTRWDYGLGFDVLGLAIEAVARKALGEYLQERLFKPLGMLDTAFVVAADKSHRYAQALPLNPETGKPQAIRDARKPTKFECGGACAVSTAADYLRFAQMLLNQGSLNKVRILGRKTVEYMTADHLGPEVDVEPLRNYPNINGYSHGLGVAVRRGYGVAGVMGSPGDYHWAGFDGTNFWVDPKEQLVVVFMAHTPGPARFHYRQVVNALVLQAVVE